MQIFKLKPIDPNHRAWRSLPPRSYIGEAVVRAKDEATARRACAVAFGKWHAQTTSLDATTPFEVVWSSPAVVSCEPVRGPEFSTEGPTQVITPDIDDDEVRACIEQL